MKQRLNLTIDPHVVERSREMAGLIPFSRYVEELLRNEIMRYEKEGR